MLARQCHDRTGSNHLWKPPKPPLDEPPFPQPLHSLPQPLHSLFTAFGQAQPLHTAFGQAQPLHASMHSLTLRARILAGMWTENVDGEAQPSHAAMEAFERGACLRIGPCGESFSYSPHSTRRKDLSPGKAGVDRHVSEPPSSHGTSGPNGIGPIAQSDEPKASRRDITASNAAISRRKRPRARSLAPRARGISGSCGTDPRIRAIFDHFD